MPYLLGNRAEGTKGRAEGQPTNPRILVLASCSKRRLCARCSHGGPNILVMLAGIDGLVETYFGKARDRCPAGVALVFPASC